MTWTVLVVDDEEDIRDSLVDVLAARGYRVVAARDGKVAWGLLEDGGLRPSVILLDLMMPVMDGWTFLERQAVTPELQSIPVIVLSAAIAASPLPAPVACNLNKPVRLKTLLSAIETACQSPGVGGDVLSAEPPPRVALGTGAMLPVTARAMTPPLTLGVEVSAAAAPAQPVAGPPADTTASGSAAPIGGDLPE